MKKPLLLIAIIYLFCTDISAQGITITAPADYYSIVNTTNLYVAGSTFANTVVYLALNDGSFSITTNSDLTGKFTFASVGLSEGANTIQVKAYDPQGAAYISSFNVNLDTQAPLPPVITYPANNQVLSTLSVVIGSAEPKTMVTGKIDNTFIITTIATSIGQFSFSPIYTINDPGGVHELVVNVTDQAGNTSGDAVVTFSIDRYHQSISFPALGNHTFDDVPFSLFATASSGLPVSYSVTGPAAIAGNVLSITGTGEVTVTAFQDGAPYYYPASAVQTFTVDQASQTISFSGLEYATYGVAIPAANISASSGLPVSLALTGPAAMVDGNLSFTGVGEVTVTASQDGNANYLPVSGTRTFTVNPASQTISFPAFVYETYGTIVPANASVNSGLPVSLAITGPAVIVGNNISFTGIGNVTVTASQSGNANYLPAADVSHSFYVYQGFQNFTFTGIPAYVTYTTAPFGFNALFTSGLPANVTFSGPAAIANGIVTVTGAGVVTITAFQGGNALYRPTTIVRYFQVYKADQAITFAGVPYSKTVNSLPFTVNATAGSGLPVSFSVTGPAAISGNTITLNGTTGTVSVTAYQPGNANYKSASSVVRYIMVNSGGRIGIDSVETSSPGIYPNPASQYVYVTSDSPVSDIEIYNPAGILVVKTGAAGKIDLSSLYGGLYTFRIMNESGVHTSKIVIEK